MSRAVDMVHQALGTRRGELVKLSDAELAARLHEAWDRYDQADRKRRPFFWRNRRTAQLPLAYRLWAGFHGSPGFRIIDFFVRAQLSELWIFREKPLLVSEDAIEADQQIEEIQALMAEIKRRVDRRKVST
jgi:hypothetical protein